MVDNATSTQLIAMKSIETDKMNEVYNELRLCGQLCDVSLVIDNNKIRAHKMVLAASSPYFRSMFTLNMMEKTMDEVNITGISYEVMEQLVEYIYTKQIVLTRDNACSILFGSDYLQLVELVNQCAQYLLDQNDLTNCLMIRSQIKPIVCNANIIYDANEYISINFLKLAKDTSFIELDITDIIDILSLDQLYIDSEEDVYCSGMRWLKADINRHVHIHKILKCVRIPFICQSFLNSFTIDNQMIQKDIDFRQFKQLAIDYHRNNDKKQYIASRIRPRTYIGCRGVILTIPTKKYDEIETHSDICEVYDEESGEWKKEEGIGMLELRCTVVVHGRQIYTIGGIVNGISTNTVRKYDYVTKEWTNLPPLLESRTDAAAVFVGSKLYVIGGGRNTLKQDKSYYNGMDYPFPDENLMTTEIFDIDTNIWEYGPTLMEETEIYSSRKPGAALLGKYIYVFGGLHIQRLNIITNKWEYVKNVWNEGCDAVTYKGKIYTILDDDYMSGQRGLFKVYDPIENTYTTLKSMRNGNRIKLVSSANGVYAFCGSGKKCILERYDEKVNNWIRIPASTTRKFQGVTCFIPNHNYIV